MEPTRPAICAILAARRAAHLPRWADQGFSTNTMITKLAIPNAGGQAEDRTLCSRAGLRPNHSRADYRTLQTEDQLP